MKNVSILLLLLLAGFANRAAAQQLFERIGNVRDLDSIEAIAQQYFSQERASRAVAAPTSNEDDDDEARFNRWLYLEKSRSYPQKKLRNWRLKNLVEAVKFYNAPIPPNTTKKLLVPIPASNGQWTQFGSNHPTGSNACSIGRTTFVESLPGDPNTLFTGSPTSTLWRSTDNGATWTSLTDDLPAYGTADLAIDPANTSTYYLATGDPVSYGGGLFNSSTGISGVFKSTNAGASWANTGVPTNTSIKKIKLQPGSSSNVWISTTNGLYISTNGLSGTTIPTRRIVWETGDFEFKTDDPNTALLAGLNFIARTTNGGTVWDTLDATNGLPAGPFSRIELAVSPANANVMYALFTDGTGFRGLFRSTDAGLNWTQRSNTPNIMTSNSSGGAGRIQVPYDVALAVNPTNTDIVVVGGILTWRSTDGGATWSHLGEPGGHTDIQNLRYLDGNLYCNSDGSIYRSTDDGSNWTDIGGNIAISQYYRIGGTPQNTDLYLAGAQDDGDSRLTPGTQNCLISCCDGMENAIDYTNQNVYLSFTQNGALNVSDNGGASFNGATPTGGGPWVTSAIFHATDPDTIFYGGTDVWRGVRSGNSITWKAMGNPSSALDINQLAHSPANTSVLYVARGAAGAQRTDNAMANSPTWTNISAGLATPVQYVAVDPGNAAHVYMAIGGYTNGSKVFESTNSGTNWTNISANLPNVPANCIVFEPGGPNRVYVGTDIGVFYRDDNTGARWVQFSNGLPIVPVFELEINGGWLSAAVYGRGLWRSPTLATCLADLTLAPGDDPGSSQSSGVQYYSASNSIRSTRQVTGGAETNVNYKAGNFTLLLPDFRASGFISTGSFKVTADGCNTPFPARSAPVPPKQVSFDGNLKAYSGY